MAEEEQQPRTPEEIRVEVAKVVAETEKLKAETRKAEADAFKAELEAREAFRKRQLEKADDEENHLYRFAGEVNKNSVNNCMKHLTRWSRLQPKCDIEIIFSSPGGSIIDGFELFDFLQDLRGRGHQITTGALGMAASMAGILLQAGDVRWVGGQAWVMIHRAAFGAFGKTYEVEDEVEFVKRIEGRILDIFTARSKLTRRKIMKNWDRKDWWISPDEALELSLVDEIRASLPEMKPPPPKKPRKAPKKKTKTPNKNTKTPNKNTKKGS
jgi:ATP-dependent Clp endopeptidase proteolytic subunit ClpP